MKTGSSKQTTSWVGEHAKRRPKATALILDENVISYGELGAAVEKTARGLAAWGITSGDRIAIISEPGLPFVEVLHACQRIGATFVPMNLRLSANELGSQLETLQPDCVLCDEASAGLAHAATQEATLERARSIDEISNPSSGTPTLPADRIDLDALHSILFTSGTTARPKAVGLTNGNFLASIDAGVERIGREAHDCWLATMPLFHVGGLAILMRAARLGSTVILHPGFDPDRVARDLRRYPVTGVSLVAAMLFRLLSSEEFEPEQSTLCCMLIGGGPLPETLANRAREHGLPIAPTYGMTETTAQIATGIPGATIPAPGFVGRPMYGVEARIHAPDAHGRGEIQVRGPQIISSYLGRGAEARTRFQDDWLRTGDLGRLDEEGNLYVEDRIDDLIITGGENVSPREVEEVLVGHQDVIDAAVVGRDDPQWGQRIEAYLVLAPGIAQAPQELRGWCRKSLAGYKIPQIFHRVASLPRNPAGKLDRRHLADAKERA